jgi:hypothetical protein
MPAIGTEVLGSLRRFSSAWKRKRKRKRRKEEGPSSWGCRPSLAARRQRGLGLLWPPPREREKEAWGE